MGVLGFYLFMMIPAGLGWFCYLLGGLDRWGDARHDREHYTGTRYANDAYLARRTRETSREVMRRIALIVLVPLWPIVVPIALVALVAMFSRALISDMRVKV